ncbi:aluminum-activated malate transporter 2 [Cucumis melo var. makuwa]|uniref:Aluminum-activated malate transporter 2 n=2 Tax=Cucumis melo var. makuwa TaxID=1194695 RepID=A0A5D3D8B0_CUCMM|nr:aluminum-activated malate transporter 2 [Cucumis melo var. makuwa]
MVKESEEILTNDHHGCFKGKACNLEEKVVELANNTKKVGKDDPRRIVHSLKLGLAAAMVSSFYYFEPLYDSFGASSIWAIITVIVVFEFSVGKLAYNAHSCWMLILLRVLVQRTPKASEDCSRSSLI